MGDTNAAGTEFGIIAKAEPKDQLSQSFAKAFTKTKETTPAPVTATASATAAAPAPSTPVTSAAPTAGTPAPGSATEPAEAPPPPPPPAELTGTWKAAASADTNITLALQADGAYTWDVATKGQPSGAIKGHAAYVNDVLSLTQEDGPPLAGKIESKDASKFVMRLMGGGANAPALTFTR
jgi:hypothetical protein